MLTRVNDVIFQCLWVTVDNSNNKNYSFLFAFVPPHFEKRSATHGIVCWKGNFSTAHNMLDIKFDSYVVHAIQLIQKVDYTYFP